MSAVEGQKSVQTVLAVVSGCHVSDHKGGEDCGGAALEPSWRADSEQCAHEQPEIQRTGVHEQPVANVVVTS